MQLQGSLSELKLPDILQLASMSKETCVIEFLNAEGITGKVVFDKGELIYAKVLDLSGDEAVYEIAIWFEGTFKSADIDKDYPVNIRTNITGLLMEAARRLDEWRVLSKKIPSMSYFPYPLDEEKEIPTLNTAEWDILKYVDGSRNIREIAVATGWSPFRVSKLLYGLLINNLIGLSKIPTKEKATVENTLLSKLDLLKKEALAFTDDEFAVFVTRAINDGFLALKRNPKDKSAVIDAANKILQELMIFKGKEKSKELAAKFRNILRGKHS
jgi:hypothetical protein